jgi:hypothetical protein
METTERKSKPYPIIEEILTSQPDGEVVIYELKLKIRL